MPVLPQEGREAGERPRVVVGVDGVVEAVADEGAEVVRKSVGIHALALDEPRVAERGLFRGPAPVDEGDRASAFLQVQRGADADDAGAQHDRVGVRGPRAQREGLPAAVLSASNTVPAACPEDRTRSLPSDRCRRMSAAAHSRSPASIASRIARCSLHDCTSACESAVNEANSWNLRRRSICSIACSTKRFPENWASISWKREFMSKNSLAGRAAPFPPMKRPWGSRPGLSSAPSTL